MLEALHAGGAAKAGVEEGGGRAEAADGDQGAVEMIRNPVALALFRGVIRQPLAVLLGWHIALFCCVALASQYTSLKHKPVKWHPYNNDLKAVQEALAFEFGIRRTAAGWPFESAVVWSEKPRDLRGSPDFREVIAAVGGALQTITSSGVGDCVKQDEGSGMTWQSYSPLMPPSIAKRLISADGSAAIVLIANPCNIPEIRKQLAAIDRRHNGLRVALGSPNAVVQSSVDETTGQVVKHMVICAPIMMALLWYNTGSLFRAATAFIALLCSEFGTQAITVIIKWCWPGLNYQAPSEVVLMFVELALCLDYCLFFWTRFSQERRRLPELRFYEQALMQTLQTSGAVIMVSVSVLVVGTLSMCFYPDQNTLECLAGNIQMIIGIVLLGMYSLVIPGSLAAYFPSLFDEGTQRGCCWRVLPSRLSELGFRAGNSYKALLARMGVFVTSQPWIIILPLLVYACLCPLILQLRHFQPNFNMFDASTSPNVPEYAAFRQIEGKLNVGTIEPVSVLLEAHPMGPESHAARRDDVAMLQSRAELLCPNCSDVEAGARAPSAPKLRAALRQVASSEVAAGVAAGVALEAPFGQMVCRYIENVVRGTRGHEFQIRAEDVHSVWWNSTSGSCLAEAEMQHDELLSTSGTKQQLHLYPPVHRTSDGSKAMTRFFWGETEPRSRGTFRHAGQLYEFRARHLTDMATIMLVEEKYARRAPAILAVLVVLICMIVGALFSSVGLGLKMIVTVVLPIIAEFGLTVGIYQYGWMEWAGIPRTHGLVWSNLYTTVGLLLGLAVDYDIFLFARVYERRLQGYDNRSAVRLAVNETASVITVAGTVMVVSFFFVSLSSIFLISQIGVLYLFGVAFDTYVIRTVLAPSILCLSETMNYWPGKVPPVTKSWHVDVKTL